MAAILCAFCKRSKTAYQPDQPTLITNTTVVLDAEHLIANQKVKTKTYIWLGKLFIQQKKWDEAKSTIQNAIQYATETDDAPRLIQAHMVMGDCLKRVEGEQSASEQYKLAHELAKKHGLRKKEYKFCFALLNVLKN